MTAQSWDRSLAVCSPTPKSTLPVKVATTKTSPAALVATSLIDVAPMRLPNTRLQRPLPSWSSVATKPEHTLETLVIGPAPRSKVPAKFPPSTMLPARFTARSARCSVPAISPSSSDDGEPKDLTQCCGGSEGRPDPGPVSGKPPAAPAASSPGMDTLPPQPGSDESADNPDASARHRASGPRGIPLCMTWTLSSCLLEERPDLQTTVNLHRARPDAARRSRNGDPRSSCPGARRCPGNGAVFA